MSIIRIIKKLKISSNTQDNTVNNLGSTGEIHNHSDIDDSLESIYYEEIANQHCGCFAPPGGRCSECGVISCVRCHQHCGGTENPSPDGCGKPLCREHAHYKTLPDGTTIPFCKQCYGKLSRRQFRKTARHLLLSPFVQWKEDSHE